MAWTYYSSADAGAPTLNGTVGALITVLDAILINGYGAKPAAGWTKPFSGTNAAAYRINGSFTNYYFRVDDNAPGAAGAREARVTMYETMSDVNTGTNASTNRYVRKSGTLDATARTWKAVADEVTLIFFCSFDNSADYNGTYIGQFYSYMPNDQHGVTIIARTSENQSAYTPNIEQVLRLATTAEAGTTVAKSVNGITPNVNGFKTCGLYRNDDSQRSRGPYTLPNAADGSLVLTPLYISNVEGADKTLRGRVRGLWIPLHSNLDSVFAINDTWSGTGDLAGKSFVYAGSAASVGAGGFIVLETSNTVPKN
jgi:hypothetical protein